MAGRKGRSGRRPLPTEVKKAQGTYQSCRAPGGKPANEMRFPVARLVPPEWLDFEGVEEWNRIVPHLDRVKVLTEPDLIALASYCASAALAINATRQYQRDGLMKTLAKGGASVRPHPLIKVAAEARAQCLRFAIEFGLTPAARSRVLADQQPPEVPQRAGAPADADEDFFYGKRPKLVASKP